ncbi:MAG: hypothetical protein DRN71_04605 [Candidatus Nanohalarchaeota archaeon]|nr:MAG: hypothetical protein DRN71_04605 [Candidatus Nanohaloarchaeota archaeon]
MVKTKIKLDDKHICSVHLKDKAVHLCVNNFPKLLTSPRFVKLALSLKAATKNAVCIDNTEPKEEPLDIKFDTNFIKSIFR